MQYYSNIRLEGIVSIEAAIKASKRSIFKVYVDKDKVIKRDRKAIHFTSVLKKANITYELCDRAFIDTLSDGNSHGGFVADVSDRTYCSLSDFIAHLSPNEYAVMLDGVEDPFNFGYSIRNLYAFGCKGFIIPERNWMDAASVVARASAGASELCELVKIKSDEELCLALKQNNIDIICSALSSSSIPLFDFKPDRPFVLFIGGEKRGISKTFMENADKVVHIPYSNENAKYSLPTASCAAIFGSYLSGK